MHTHRIYAVNTRLCQPLIQWLELLLGLEEGRAVGLVVFGINERLGELMVQFLIVLLRGVIVHHVGARIGISLRLFDRLRLLLLLPHHLFVSDLSGFARTRKINFLADDHLFNI